MDLSTRQIEGVIRSTELGVVTIRNSEVSSHSDYRTVDAAAGSEELARALIKRCNVANLKIAVECGVGQINTPRDSASIERQPAKPRITGIDCYESVLILGGLIVSGT